MLGLLRLPYWGVSQPSRTESSVLARLWSLQQPPTQVPLTSANVNHNLCCGLWFTTSGLRPGHFTDSYWMASRDWGARPVLSDGDWELCVLLPAAWDCQLSQQTRGEPACGRTSLNASGLFSRKQGKISAGWFTWEGGNWLHTEKRPWLSWLIYSNFSQL